MSKVLVPLAEGFEEIEAVTIVDVLRRADVEVVVAGLKPGPVTGSHGIRIQTDLSLDQVTAADYALVALPGGMPGADHLERDPRLRRLLTEMAQAGKVVSAICAAPKVLASAGLLRDKQATSYPGFLDPKAVGYREDPVVTDGNIITSRGPATAMQFALTLVERLAGAAKRAELEQRMLVTRAKSVQ
jgi:4-methyl-5(b-hydroxyethyl)-thiazole monophosphate biosynthesis